MVLNFQNKIKNFQRGIFSKSFCHFPNVKIKTNAFPEKTIADYKVEKNKNHLQGLQSSS